MTQYLLAFSFALMLVSSAVAQTKTSGTLDCGKADQTYTLQVPDQEGFSYAISKGKCTWTKPFTVADLESTVNVSIGFDELMGASGQHISSGYTQFKNGDKAFWRYTATLDTKKMISSGPWTYTRGTGKLLGIKGSGTGSCKPKSAEPGSGGVCEVKGEYTLPAAKK